MQSTAEEVKILQEELKSMKPALELAAADAEVMIAQIAKDTVLLIFHVFIIVYLNLSRQKILLIWMKSLAEFMRLVYYSILCASWSSYLFLLNCLV